MRGGYFVLTLLVLIVDGVFGDEVTVMEGDTVTLNTDVTKQKDEQMQWYFNNIRIALINGSPRSSCLFDGEGGIFRDRLKVNYETGSLNITNISPEHAGRYELEFFRSDSTGKSTPFVKNKDRVRNCSSTQITSKISSENFKIFSVFVTAAEKKEPQSTENMIPGSAQSPVGKAGIFVGVIAVAVVLLV